MNFGVIATTVLSLAVLNGAYAATDKNRVLVEARWYTEAYVKEHLPSTNSSFLGEIFHKKVTYSFSGDTPEFQPNSANLLEKPITMPKSGFLRWPPKKGGNNLATELDAKCVSLIGQSLRGLEQGARQRIVGGVIKGIVISGIQTGELASAPLDLDMNSKKILVSPPMGDGKIRCNIYKTLRGGYVAYDVYVVLIATAAYWRD